jgi:hypothetical protein
MSQLLEIQKQIEIASQRIVALERALRDHPDLPSVSANLDTAVRLRYRLERQFAEVAGRVGYDVCRYRAFDDHDRPAVAAAFKSIADFQRLVSVVYAAKKHGPKERATIPEDVANESSFDFGYAVAGSIEVVLTVRNEKTLFDNSLLDDSLEAVFDMPKVKNSKDVLRLAETLGPGPINALYEWAVDNASCGLNAEIDWRKGENIQRSVVVQHQELSHLKKAIEQTSSEKVETISVIGKLTMADATKNKFKIEQFGLPVIHGTVAAEAIDDRHKVTLPNEYSAKIRKTTRTKFATGKQETEYHLMELGLPTKSDANPRKKGSQHS